MQMIVTGRHCHVDQELRDAFAPRFENLRRFEPRVSRAEVTVTALKHGFEAEALLSVDRAERVHAKAEGPEMRSALDRVLDKLAVQLRRAHDRHHSHRAPPMDEIFAAPDLEPEPGEGLDDTETAG
ncbi:MAG: ribosome-associated translation inhibitor RaiA [Gemmatimonadota bacterium]|nr:ribosome-associated translation inhibitor RaiA [Gemmatimonadota bacterium]